MTCVAGGLADGDPLSEHSDDFHEHEAASGLEEVKGAVRVAGGGLCRLGCTYNPAVRELLVSLVLGVVVCEEAAKECHGGELNEGEATVHPSTS